MLQILFYIELFIPTLLLFQFQYIHTWESFEILNGREQKKA
jgi:hypothetical protein